MFSPPLSVIFLKAALKSLPVVSCCNVAVATNPQHQTGASRKNEYEDAANDK